jgi:hypothetical protein
VIYLDSSVALASLLAEDRAPPANLWMQPLISSRLLTYEIWNRVNARGGEPIHGEATRLLIGRLHLVELSPAVLGRALDPFPVLVRTVDALHLATIEFLRSAGQPVELATYDQRLAAAARSLGVALAEI